MTSRTARFALALVLPILGFGVLFGSYLLTKADLPDRVASHFDFQGQPDDSMTPTQFMVVLGVLALVGSLLLLAVAIWSKLIDRPMAATGGFLGGFLLFLASAIGAQTFFTHRNLADWTDASGPGLHLIWIVAAASAAGSLGAWIATQLRLAPEDPEMAAGESPVMALGGNEQAVWSRTHRSIGLTLLGVALGLIALPFIFFDADFIAVAIGLGLGAIITLSLASVRVHADSAGLHISYGGLPWPKTHIPIAHIGQASVIDVRPMKWGGWGYRGSLKLMNQAALVHRAGPGIRLDLDGGKIFVVTVDDPEQPVALLNAMVDRQD